MKIPNSLLEKSDKGTPKAIILFIGETKAFNLLFRQTHSTLILLSEVVKMMKFNAILALIFSSVSMASDFSCPDGKTYPVSLTFDDGPAGAKTMKALDILKKMTSKELSLF